MSDEKSASFIRDHASTIGKAMGEKIGEAMSSAGGTGLNAQGVVLCNQPRVLDLQKRGAAFVEKAPQAVMDEVLAEVMTLLE